MSIVGSIVKSDFFVLVVIPITIITGVLYLCKVYNFSIIPESLRGKAPKRKKKGKFKVPNITRKEMDKNLGRAGKYQWILEEDDRENSGNRENDRTFRGPPVPISEVRVGPHRNMYS